MRQTWQDRFAQKVDDSGECWVWTGSCSKGGYGNFYRDGRILGAHRVAWELFVGPIPEGLWVLHSCDNPPCVNPAHLFLGTPKANAEDMVRKQRHALPKVKARGETHGNAKLDEAEVAAMRYRHSHGESYASIAREFGVAISAAWNAINGITWKHVPVRP